MNQTTDADDIHEDSKPSWWRRPGCLLLAASGLLVLAAFFAFCVYVPPLRISEETTRITGPLTPDGQIDFLKYLEETTYPPEMKTDDNGFRVFLRTFGDLANQGGENDDFYTKQKYEKLGLDPEEKPTMTMPPEPETVIKEYYAQKGETPPQDYYDACRKPWTVEQLPMMADWLKEIDAPLDATAEMIRKPVFFPPLLEHPVFVRSGKPQPLFTIDIYTELQMYRSLARMFHARAFHRIATNDIDGAVNDTMTIHHLARKIAGGRSFMLFLVGVAIDGMAHSIPVTGNPGHPPTKEQLRRLIEENDALPLFPAPENSFEWERVWALSALQAVSKENIPMEMMTNNFDWFDVYSRRADMNIAFRHINMAYDTLTGWLPRSEFHRYTTPPDVKRVAKLVLTTFGRGYLTGEVLASITLSNVEGTERAARRTVCLGNMKRLTLALLMHKAEHGAFPKEDWFERIKPYLGEQPERCLRCPSCVSLGFGTNYALILHEKPPEDPDTLLLVELREPVPMEEAFFMPEEALPKFTRSRSPRPIGSMHPGITNMARRNGAVESCPETIQEEELRRLLGIETEGE